MATTLEKKLEQLRRYCSSSEYDLATGILAAIRAGRAVPARQMDTLAMLTRGFGNWRTWVVA